MGDGAAIEVRELGDVVLTIFDGRQADEDVDRYLSRLAEIHARGDRYLGASLMLRYESPPAQIRRVGKWMSERKDETARLCAGSAIVAPRPGFRFVLSALFMIQRMPMPYTVEAKPLDAVRWAVELGRREGLDVPVDLARVFEDELAARAPSLA